MKKLACIVLISVFSGLFCFVSSAAPTFYADPKSGVSMMLPDGFYAVDTVNYPDYPNYINGMETKLYDFKLVKDCCGILVSGYTRNVGWWDIEEMDQAQLTEFEQYVISHHISGGKISYVTAESGQKFLKYTVTPYNLTCATVKNGMLYQMNYTSGNHDHGVSFEAIVNSYTIPVTEKPVFTPAGLYDNGEYSLTLPEGFVIIGRDNVEDYAQLLERWYMTVEKVQNEYSENYNLFAHSYLENKLIYLFRYNIDFYNLNDADTAQLDDLRITQAKFIAGLGNIVDFQGYVYGDDGRLKYLRVSFHHENDPGNTGDSYIFVEKERQYELRFYNCENRSGDLSEFQASADSFTVLDKTPANFSNDYPSRNFITPFSLSQLMWLRVAIAGAIFLAFFTFLALYIGNRKSGTEQTPEDETDSDGIPEE